MIDITHILSYITGKKVLVQLSGGKDSMTCLVLLKKMGVELDAIHFIHAYNYSLPTEMAKNICNELGVPLHVKNVTDELSALLLADFKGRPCRYCKAIMDQITVNFAMENGISVICIGDTGDDTTLINRLIDIEGEIRPLSKYINKSVSLPDDITVIRPLLNYHGDEIIEFVQSTIPDFKRVHDTGDKYFEYSREGCPLQFKDLGAVYTEDVMKKLQVYNSLCSEFAMYRNIRASIHLPSEFIVTIPRGYEDECREFLLSKGCNLNNTSSRNIPLYIVTAHLRTNGITLSDGTLSEALMRFIERLGHKPLNIIDNSTNIQMFGDGFETECFKHSTQVLSITITSSFSLNQRDLENLCVEIFHTYNYVVHNTKL